MKFTKREKRLLLLLLFVLATAGYFNFYLKPQLEAVNELNKEIEEYSEQYELNLVYQEKVKDMDSRVKILTQRVQDLRVLFPPVINYDEVLVIIRDTAKESGISVQSISFTENVQATASNSKDNDSQNKEELEKAKITDNTIKDALNILGFSSSIDSTEDYKENKTTDVPDGKGYKVTVNLSAIGTNSEIKKFIRKINGLENKVTFSNLSINNGEEGQLSTSFTLNFYGIMDRNAEGYSLLADGSWTPLETAGKENIFRPYGGYVEFAEQLRAGENRDAGGESGVGGNILDEIKKYDFSVGVVPYGNNIAPPSVSVAARHLAQDAEATSIPIIYGDSSEQEEVELYFEEKDGRLYCKFKTGKEAFPDKNYSNSVEFKTSGTDIRILIESTPRKYKGDTGGANISIINNTSRTVIADITNEDENKPRVKIHKKEGDVRINF